MRFNNAKSKRPVSFIYAFLVVLAVVSTLYLYYFSKGFKLNKLWYFFPLITITTIIYMYKNAKFFEFDGDGNALTFINKGLLISNFINYREKRAEFPKNKLKSYKIYNYIIYRTVSIYIKSKNNGTIRLNFNISFLSLKKQRHLKSSLDTILQCNH